MEKENLYEEPSDQWDSILHLNIKNCAKSKILWAVTTISVLNILLLYPTLLYVYILFPFSPIIFLFFLLLQFVLH